MGLMTGYYPEPGNRGQQMNKVKPTVAAAIRMGALRGGWSSYKHGLVRARVIANPDCDAPLEWKNAFLRANKRQIVKT